MSSQARQSAKGHSEHRSSHRTSPPLPIPSSPAYPPGHAGERDGGSSRERWREAGPRVPWTSTQHGRALPTPVGKSSSPARGQR